MMKEKLRQIFLDLTNRKISEAEALEKIKIVKSSQNSSDINQLCASPIWKLAEKSVASQAIQTNYTQHNILLIQSSQIEEKQLEELVPESSCFHIETKQKDIVASFNEIAISCFENIKKLLSSKPTGKILVQIVIGNQLEAEIYTSLSALLKTASLENHNLVGQIIISDELNAVQKLGNQLVHEQNYSKNTLVKYTNNDRYIKSLQKLNLAQAEPKKIIKENGVYLITGGFGGLGILFANEILAQTNKVNIILTGRSELTQDKKDRLEKMSKKDAKVSYIQLDVTNENDVKNSIETILKDYKTLHGIFHSAGVNKDNFILKKSVAEFKEVMDVKVAGTYNLDLASKEIDLDFLVIFSSFASWFGNPGQSDYATANAFADQFSVYRNELVKTGERNGKTLSINWPLWEKGGMIIADEIKQQLQKETGISPLDAESGMNLFYHCMNFSHSQIIAVKGDLDKIEHTFFSTGKKQVETPIAEKSSISNTPKTSTAHMDGKQLFNKTSVFLRDEFSKIIKLPSDEIDEKAQLEKYGIDSILAMNLTTQLEKTFGKLSKTLFFEYQTINALSEYFSENYKDILVRLFSPVENNTSSIKQETPKVTPTFSNTQSDRNQTRRKTRNQQHHSAEASFKTENSAKDEPIAIIGLSGRYPESPNIQEYWKNLKNGKDCIVEVPKDRWDWKEFYSQDRTEPNRHYSKWGGFIAGVDEFDPRFFNIAPREAKNIDPQERLFLQHSWMAMEDAGYTRESLHAPSENNLPGQVGVYVGVMYGEYNLSGSLASIANRVSYVLNLHGPSITLDTMCSSSLTSVHLACQDLKLGRTNLAIAGGVNVSVNPNKYQMLSTGQFISSDGNCQSFGEGGDGYIPGEGVGVVLLKRLSEAEKDGDHIYGIIKGSALNHGGKTNGYSVPNPQAQASVISQALRESNTDPRHVSYIEAHGTGTKLGDPIEMTSLNKAFNQAEENHFCLLGSAKSNIGHCESAAGIAGITKILLQLQHKQVVPSLHSKKLNPHIDFDNTPFVVNQSLKTWDNPIVDNKRIPRIAGVSSFGAGGANAHIIIQEHTQSEIAKISIPTHTPNTEVAIVLSARTESQLKEKAHDLLVHFEDESTLDLLSMSYTLQVGREAMELRFAVVVSSLSELKEALLSYVNDARTTKTRYEGKVKDHRSSVLEFGRSDTFEARLEAWIEEKSYTNILDWWTKGLDIQWTALYGTKKPQRISLPTYPFAKESYWIETSARAGMTTNGNTATILHPLVHTNTSDVRQTRFSSTFSGDEFFINDYKTTNENQTLLTLPFSISIEMARVAIEKGLPASDGNTVLALRDVRFGSSITLTKNQPIQLVLFAQNEDSVAYEIYSDANNDDVIYSQGEATYLEASSVSRLDIHTLQNQLKSITNSIQGIKTLYVGEHQVLAHLQLSTEVEATINDYKLHPSILESAIQSAIGLVEAAQSQTTSIIPTSISSVEIRSACTKEMYAWIRYNNQKSNLLDIDLCDANGTICVQIHGIAYHQTADSSKVATPTIVEKVVAQPEIVQTKQQEVLIPAEATINYKTPREITLPTVSNTTEKISLETTKESTPVIASLKKPTGISLNAPETTTAKKQQPLEKTQVTLSLNTVATPVKVSNSAASLVHLYDNGRGIYTLKIKSENTKNTLSAELTAQLASALKRAESETTLKVLLLEGLQDSFLHGVRNGYNVAIDQKLHQQLISFPYPVIAALEGSATGIGFLVGALCDFMICNEKANYRYTQLNEGFYPSTKEVEVFEERFGAVQANDFLLPKENGHTGSELKAKGWTLPIVATSEVAKTAQNLAENLAKKSQTSLKLLKQHLARHISAKVANLQKVVSIEVNTKVKFDTIKLPKTTSFTVTQNDSIAVLNIKKKAEKGGITSFVKEISAFFKLVNSAKNYSPILLTSEYSGFLPESATANDILAFTQEITNAKFPVIAVLDKGASAKAWFTSQFCDVTLYQKDATYNATGLVEISELSQQAAFIFAHRFGNHNSKEILLLGSKFSGSDLQKQIGSIQVFEKDNGLSAAIKIAKSFAKLPTENLVAWKASQAKTIQENIAQLAKISIKKETSKKIPLTSSVVKTTLHAGAILEVKFEDRESKNMFTDAFIAGVTEVFEHIENNDSYKVIILTGYDNYFASGGTKEGLFAIQEGKSKFTDIKIYQLAMECKIPVIAAMQGHGIGAGWALGAFADFVLFSKERKYVSPYMNYGFTPGAAATFIFPEIMGYDLARETLLTGNEYGGSEFKDRGTHLPVLPKDEVVDRAMEIAKQLANLPRTVLMAFKQQSTEQLIVQAEATKKLELAMHEKTFVGDQETLKQIKKNFTHESSNTVVKEIAVENEVEETTSEKNMLSDVIDKIRFFLAGELHLEEDEIDDDSQFVDIGLDSITGVTWVRKINDYYKTALEATQIYSYTTLTKLGTHLTEELEKLNPTATIEETQIHAQVETLEEVTSEDIYEETTTNEDLQSEIIAKIKLFLAKELHLEEDEIDEDAQFVDIGLDSITGVTWIRKINDNYKTSLEATQIYSHTTLTKLGTFVKEELERLGLVAKNIPTPKKVASVVSKPVAKPTTEKKPVFQFTENKLTSLRAKLAQKTTSKKSSPYKVQPIAVVGIAGQFPESKNKEEFWNNIAQGKNCITEVSKERWDTDTYYAAGNPAQGKTNSKWLGSVEDYDKFDPLFFTISPIEAESMDPQQRLFLEACWHGIEDAGYNPKALSGSKCGVFVGCATGDYQLLSREQQLSAQGFTGGTSSILAARISYFLNLQGPCLAIDTACSSSLVAISSACDSLISGASDVALAGGVYIMTGPEMHIKTAQSGMLSTDGKCHTFDQEANGFAPGEGVGVVMLKRLEDAEKDNDKIYGVIQGWGVNQDGRTNGITAPNAESQIALEQDVYDKFDINPEEIQLIEAHGTGTKLGDPIEIDALKRAFKKYTKNEEYCALGSVKSNIGHCLTAAGVAGFMKVLLAMQHKQLPPTINYNKLNEHISLKNSPFYINDSLTDWNVAEGIPRQAAISAFGFSGTNSHMVLAEYIPKTVTKQNIEVITQNQKYLVPISAKNTEQLEEMAVNLLSYIEKNKASVDLVEMSYSLQIGREAMEERLGFMVTSVDELASKLQDFINGEDAIKDVYQGQVKKNKAGLRLLSNDKEIREMIVKKWIADKKLNKLLDLWTRGLDVDWNILYGEAKPERMRLPLYPFARERYWIENTAVHNQTTVYVEAVAKVHPLLHQNTASLKEQGFTDASEQKEYLVALNGENSKQGKIKRINLPTYPFAEEKCWPERKSATKQKESIPEFSSDNLDSIEELINKIDDESMDTDQAIILLKELI
ncbi:Polyketide synthase PksL [Kordia antarctica]|uniref:Polyketide synthase PksL n=1 Tax=Kordia antarctica TaxID=1218801 RepID=A0A7L4ZI46_9FLAO|nr:SDR family NAD(P)-dependent oxidoreductase [Kordia antarctica]QHI36099.1 Polyketide synthase PksL [Kordia antarctica]